MHNETKKTALPNLRFPEFRDAGEWEILPLGKLIEGVSKRNRDKQINRVFTNSAVSGIIDQRDFFDKDIATEGKTDNYSVVELGDYIYNPRISEFAPVGPTSRNKLGVGIVSPLYTVFRFHNPENEFYEYYFRSTHWQRSLKAIGNSGARHDRMGISLTQLRKVEVPVIGSEEQQKIAATLSSLDDLITAQSAQLAALQAHKRGLMQALFPAEGETVPKLRFPEFQGVGEWVYKDVSDFAKVTTGNKDTQNKIEEGIYPFFVRSQTVERINSFSYDGEAVLTSGDGVGVGKNFHYINGKFDFHQRVYCIYNFAKEVSGKFFYLYFSEYFGNRVQKLSAKNSVDSVRMSMITEMQICIPSFEEQQKIADCLTSLDNRISAQTEKIEALKLHKKGLMQHLFPAAAEATA